MKAKAHEVHIIGTLVLFMKNFAVQQVNRVGICTSQTTVTLFYFRDVTDKLMDTYFIGPVVPAQHVV